MTAATLRYEDIALGSVYAFERTMTAEDGMAFSRLTGDENPLHIDAAFAATSSFGKNVAHGMLVAGLFSQLIGMHCPGKNALYVAQTLEFRNPIFYGDRLTVRGTVTQKHDAIRLITMKTEVLRGDDAAVVGEARVRVL